MNAFALSLDGGLLEASAGTGKTFTLATLYLRLLFERRLPVESILVVTFTVAATAELRSKLRARLRLVERALRGEALAPEDRGAVEPHLLPEAQRGWQLDCVETALQSFDGAPILTIHGFCNRLLGELAFESGSDLGMELSNVSGTLLADHVAETLTNELGQLSVEEVDALRGELVDLDGEVKILRTCLEQSSAVLVPAAVPRPSLAAVLARWQAAAARLRETLRSDRATFEARLDGAKLKLRKEVTARRLDALAAIPVEGRLDKAQLEALTALGERTYAVKDHPVAQAIDEAIDARAAVASGLDAMLLYLRRRLVDTAHARVAAWREAHRVRDFQSLIEDVARALRGPCRDQLLAAAQARYRAALIDEFQDTDPLQFEIFDALFGASRLPLFLIGDPKQAIYGFRGADLHAYLAVARQAANAASLDVNYRSTPALLRALNGLYTSHRRPFGHDEIRYTPVQAGVLAAPVTAPRPGLRVLWIDPDGKQATQQELLDALADDVVRGLAASPTGRASEVAILCRSGRQLDLVAEALGRRGVPTVIYTDTDVFDTSDAAPFARLVRALAEPRNASAVASALVTAAIGVSAQGLVELQADERSWEQHSERFAACHERWRQHGFLAAFRALLHDYGCTARLLALPDGERRMTNLLHLAELSHRATYEERLTPAQLGGWLERQIATPPVDLETRERRQLRLETDEAAVRLTTIHRSKGLEYPIVYVPFAGDELRKPGSFGKPACPTRFHDPDSQRLTLALDARHLSLAHEEERQEELRLLYVALTRAKHTLHVVVAPSRGLPRSILGMWLFGHRSGALGDDPWAALESELGSLGPEALYGRLADRLRPLGEDAWLERSGALPAPTGLAPSVPARGEAPVVPPRPIVPRAFRSHSFTSIVRERDADDMVKDLDFSVEAAPAEEALPRRGQTLALFASDDPVGLARFPRGSEAGKLLHRLLERALLPSAPPLDATTITAELAGAGVTPEAHGAAVQQLLTDLPAITLPPLIANAPPPRPFAGPKRQLRPELEFTLPAARDLSLHRLLEVMERHPDGLVSPDYAQSLRHRSELGLHGFLRGFVDLVFVSDGRYYVVDYKSNFLGRDFGDYHRQRLLQPMIDHHYGLQSLLYSLALHRHLAATLRGYDPGIHWGGVYYLFLRGLSPFRGPDHGVFGYRPTPELLRDLDLLLRGQPS